MRIRDLNWMQLETYLMKDDRIVLPVGSTEQHAYLSLETDNILAERASVEAAEPLGVPVLPVVPYGVTGFNYDAMGRTTFVTPPDGTSTNNNVQTKYCANSILATDQAGRWRRSTSDGLGRLVEVDEPNSTSAAALLRLPLTT